MSRFCDSPVFRDHPLLTVLGRRGRGAVLDVLMDRQHHSIRGLARAADVPPATAARAVQELEVLGAVEVLRPGRDAQVRLRADTAIGGALFHLRLPDLRPSAAIAFAQAYTGPARAMLRWQAPDDVPSDPLCPTRIAIITPDIDDALDAVGPALDAVEAAGWPAPEVAAWAPDELDRDDPIGAAILAGRPVQAVGTG